MNFVNASFIVAGLLFIFALAGLSKFETSKKGNAYGILGMVIAIVATIVALVKLPGYSPVSIVLLFIPMLIGGAFGVWKAVKVEMTGMPELIAQLHSFVGLAAVLIGFNAFAEEEPVPAPSSFPRSGLASSLALLPSRDRWWPGASSRAKSLQSH